MVYLRHAWLQACASPMTSSHEEELTPGGNDNGKNGGSDVAARRKKTRTVFSRGQVCHLVCYKVDASRARAMYFRYRTVGLDKRAQAVSCLDCLSSFALYMAHDCSSNLRKKIPVQAKCS